MSKTDGWSAMDVLATLESRDADRERSGHIPGPSVVHPSGGDHPGRGRYYIDPDYMELLGIEDPDQLARYHK